MPRWEGPSLRVALVGDLHVTKSLPLSYFESVLDHVTQLEPDLVFFAGDYVTTADDATAVQGLLKRARGRLGTYAILGNHDYWTDPARLRAAVLAAGVTLLGSSPSRLRLNGDRALLISGCEAPWSTAPWTPPKGDTGDVLLVLSHTPDNIYAAADAGASAVFAGHYHAGQAQLPLLGAIVIPSVYGRRFVEGHFVVDDTHLFVTAGVGVSSIPVRVNCPPDVTIVDIAPRKRSPPSDPSTRG